MKLTPTCGLSVLSAIALSSLLSACGPAGQTQTTKLDTPDKIATFLEGKSLTMEGANIPTHPNGYSEDKDLGQATQCYRKVTMTVGAGNYTVVSELGTIVNGKCDRTAKKADAQFVSQSALISNVAADASCFDFDVNYGAFKQEGRAQLAADRKTLTLELYFSGQATGHRCADGAVGAKSVTLSGKPFDGNSLQIYTVATATTN